MLKQAKKFFSKPDNMPKRIMSTYITLCCCTENTVHALSIGLVREKRNANGQLAKIFVIGDVYNT